MNSAEYSLLCSYDFAFCSFRNLKAKQVGIFYSSGLKQQTHVPVLNVPQIEGCTDFYQ